MERRKASLVAFILLSAYAVLSFMPITFLSYFAKPSAYAPGAYVIQDGWETSINFYAANIRTITIITLIVCLIGIVAMVLIFSGKENKFTKYGAYAPIVLAILFVAICLFEMNHISTNGTISGAYPKGDRGYYGIKLLWGFYIECALLLAAGVISFLVATNRLNNSIGAINIPAAALRHVEDRDSDIENESVAEKTVTDHTSPQPNGIEEIRKFKALFDDGIISEDEFNKKKKELLGL